MTDAYPSIDEFGPGSCTCSGTMTGCAVCSTADVLVRYGKSIPRLADGTPNMRSLGRTMGARHRAVDSSVRHGLSLDGYCTGGTNWCTYCAFLQLRAQGLPVAHQSLSWSAIEAKASARLPVILPGHYGKFPLVTTSSYSSTRPARGRSDSGFTGAHMVTLWAVNSRTSTGAIRDFIVSDSDFGSPARPVVPPHSIISRATLRAYWSAYGWSVAYVTKAPPATGGTVGALWGIDVPADIRAAYTATRVGARLTSLGVSWGYRINLTDLAAGLRKRGIDYGAGVQLVDVRALMA